MSALVLFLWWKPLPAAPAPLPSQQTATQWRDEVLLNRRVRVASWTTLCLGGALAIASGVAVGISYQHWTSLPPWLVYTFGEAALVLPGAMIATAVWSVPRG